MAGIYTKQGIDLDVWFFAGTGNQSFDIFDNTGLDIGKKFTPGSSATPTGIKIQDGRDLNQVLGAAEYGIYRTGGYPWNENAGKASSAELFVDVWESWLKSWLREGGKIVKNVSGITDDLFYRPTHSRQLYSMVVWAYSPYDGTVNFNYEKIAQAIAHNSWSDLQMYPITVQDNLKGVMLYPSTGAGGTVYAQMHFSASQAGQSTLQYQAVIGRHSDSNQPAVGTASNTHTSMSYNRRNWYFHL